MRYAIPWTPRVRDARGYWIYPGDTVRVLRAGSKGDIVEIDSFKAYPDIDRECIHIKVLVRWGWMNPDGLELLDRAKKNRDKEDK